MKIAIIYWSGTNNTETMALAIEKGVKKVSEVDVFEVGKITPDAALQYDHLLLGCPAMGSEVLEESEFEPFYLKIKSGLSGKKVALFGSYGWGTGEWMETWQAEVAGVGADLFQGKGFILQEDTISDSINQCEEFGELFAKF